MAGTVSLKTLGKWDKQIGVPLRDALNVSMDVMGRTGEEACKHALILMAQSARALTPQAKPNRKMMRDERGQYVENWRKNQAEPQKLYKWMFDDSNPNRIPGTWENARKIGHRGLAKRSWMWGLARLKPMKTGKAIPGTSRVYSITGETVNGYVKENRLDYIMKVMPTGWEAQVAMRAGNKIMAQARQRMERKWQSAVRRREKKRAVAIRSFFAKGLP